MRNIIVRGIFDELIYLEGKDKLEMETELNKEGIYDDITITIEEVGYYNKYENVVIKGWKDFYTFDVLCYISEKSLDIIVLCFSNGKPLITEYQLGILTNFIRRRKIKNLI